MKQNKEFMELYLLNYADDRFGRKSGLYRQNQLNLNLTAREQGITNIVSWSEEDLLKTNFYVQNRIYLDKSILENGYVFKPYIILDILNKIQDGDIVFYYDCGPWGVKRSLQILVDLCISNKGTFFHQIKFENSHWTKRDTFVYMDCDQPQYYKAKQVQATWMLLEKNNFTLKFVSEWLRYNLDERIASRHLENTCGLPDLPGFQQHRCDQSILTNLVVKYGIDTFNYGCKDVNRFIDLLTNN
ncbi:hypothetical protein IQ276_037870 [Desmonostoc muscorum LEGE 12446]|uniref:Uncharacterized protein n=1 Tax=Desmonostoc muscorum LEGE 12446 TaxID=1828758 RepID=A0A8J6ZX81_DESMC|nr:hypothetical protein [Desmonostoc muscorum]MCF2152070.1 hypothetical protein [Desmonostoc muscorum LEGE 12446]